MIGFFLLIFVISGDFVQKSKCREITIFNDDLGDIFSCVDVYDCGVFLDELLHMFDDGCK